MNANKSGSEYGLQGYNVIDLVAMSPSMSDFDVTKLWHMHLGYVSDKGMVVLSKRGLLCGQSTGKIECYEYYFLGK